MDASSQPIRTDTTFRALGDRRRRRALQHLIAADGTVAVTGVAAALARENSDTPRDRLELELRHVHLPKLADAGIVEYEPDRRTVRYVPDPLIETLLETSPSD